MNRVHLTIIRTNAIRYSKCTMFKRSWIIYGVWLGVLAGITYSITDFGTPLGSAMFTLIWVLVFSEGFWQAGWAVGNIDPLTGLQTEKHKNDRMFMTFMTALPLSRRTHFYLQVLLYTFICLAACVVSLLAHLAHPLMHGQVAVVLFLHVSLFSVLILVGSLQILLDVPTMPRGAITSYSDPRYWRYFVVVIPLILALIFKERIIELGGGDFGANVLLLISNNPAILLGVLALGGLFFWLAGLRFKATDIN